MCSRLLTDVTYHESSGAGWPMTSGAGRAILRRMARRSKVHTTLYTGQFAATYVAVLVTQFPVDRVTWRGPNPRVLVVTNNGNVWSARAFEWHGEPYWGMRLRAHLRDALGIDLPERLPAPSLAQVQPEWRLPIDWARRTATELDKDYATEAARSAEAVALPRARGNGDILYTGFSRYAKRSAHTLDALHAIVDEAAAHCAAVWGWDCGRLEVKFHGEGIAFGLAYDPGSGATRGVRQISLHVHLLAAYDAATVRRVVLHEFCHHWREERWPRDRRSRVVPAILREPHDDRFCDELARVDPLIDPRDRKACRYFDEPQDPSIVAAMAPTRPARAEPTWSPAVGFLTLDRYANGAWRIAWSPHPGSGQKWPRWVIHANDTGLLGLLKRFAPTSWRAVQVQAPGWPRLDPVPQNLREMVDFFVLNYPRLLRETALYLNDAQKISP